MVGASDHIPWTVWAVTFLEEQGYILKIHIFYQDNESFMNLESNGRNSACGDKSRHINIVYFFMKDVLEREGIGLVHCTTERIIPDYYTKPLQGSLFRNLRDIPMEITPFPDEGCVRFHGNVSKS